MKVGDYVQFTTYHPSSRAFAQYRKGIIIGVYERARRKVFAINDGKQTFKYVGSTQIRCVYSSS